MTLVLPARSPNLNAFAERFVLSVKSECLGRIVPLNDPDFVYVDRSAPNSGRFYTNERQHAAHRDSPIYPQDFGDF